MFFQLSGKFLTPNYRNPAGIPYSVSTMHGRLRAGAADLKAGGMRVSARVQTISSEQEQSKFHARRRLFERAGACFEGKLYKSECETYE